MEIPDAWMNGLNGGVIIGVAAALLLLVNGRIAGISGIVSRLTPPEVFVTPRATRLTSLAFIVGLVSMPVLWKYISDAPQISVTDDLVTVIFGGFLVGIGTSLGNGCTSGHGVCGLSRGSLRSAVAVGVFIATAAITVTVMRHGLSGML